MSDWALRPQRLKGQDGQSSRLSRLSVWDPGFDLLGPWSSHYGCHPVTCQHGLASRMPLSFNPTLVKQPKLSGAIRAHPSHRQRLEKQKSETESKHTKMCSCIPATCGSMVAVINSVSCKVAHVANKRWETQPVARAELKRVS